MTPFLEHTTCLVQDDVEPDAMNHHLETQRNRVLANPLLFSIYYPHFI
jgi:hypothetical protein